MAFDESIEERNSRIFSTNKPVCFVTGSVAERVGRVILRRFQMAGFQVVAHAHRLEKSIDRCDDQLVLEGAIEEEKNVNTWCEAIRERFGRIDVAVNCAASWTHSPLEVTSAEHFKQDFNVNTLGPALLCKQFGLWMAEQESGGALINIADWAIQRPYRGFAPYFTSKSALPGLTRAMAVELAERNSRIRVNALLPGPILLADSIDAQKAAQIADSCLLKRAGTAEDVAEACLFLATSPFVTGVCLPVDGGRSIYAGPNMDRVAHPESD